MIIIRSTTIRTPTGAPSRKRSQWSRTETFLSDRYRRLSRRRGKKRAIVAVGNSVLTIVWHLLSDPAAQFQDFGPDYYESKINRQRRQLDLSVNSSISPANG